MKKICIFLAEGFEETEAITVIDVLRRGGVVVDTVSTGKILQVAGRSGIEISANFTYDKYNVSNCDGIILPGGMPGTENLFSNTRLCEEVKSFYKEGKLVAAICAAPIILGRLGILNGKRACCYPGCEEELTGAIVEENSFSVDGNIITSRGIGTAIPFALALIEYLVGRQIAEEVKDSIVF